MTPSPFALWLDSFFADFDYAILAWLHGAAEAAGDFLTPFFSFVSLTGTMGALTFVLAFAFLIPAKTRKAGVCMIVALFVGAFFTNVLLKDLVARPRPFADEFGVYHAWWQFVGSPLETDYSFPSGHTTGAMAAMTAFALGIRKPVAWFGLLYVVLMGLSRNYLMVHYPSDVLGGIIVGALAAVIAAILVDRFSFWRHSRKADAAPAYRL